MLNKRPLSTDGGKRLPNISFGPDTVNEISVDYLNNDNVTMNPESPSQYRPKSGTRLVQLENTPQLNHSDSNDTFTAQILNRNLIKFTSWAQTMAH